MLETAARALKHLGFRQAETRRALDALEARHRSNPEPTVSIETVIREALALLT